MREDVKEKCINKNQKQRWSSEDLYLLRIKLLKKREKKKKTPDWMTEIAIDLQDEDEDEDEGDSPVSTRSWEWNKRIHGEKKEMNKVMTRNKMKMRCKLLGSVYTV